MALRWKAYAPNTILKSVEVQDLADNGVVQLDTAADLASADLVNANVTYVVAEAKPYVRIAAGVGADKWSAFSGGLSGLGGWAEVTATTGSPTKHEYTDGAGFDWTAYEWTGDGTVTHTDGLVDALLIGGGSGGYNNSQNNGGAGDLRAGLLNVTAGLSIVQIGSGGPVGGGTTIGYDSAWGQPSRLGDTHTSLGNFNAAGADGTYTAGSGVVTHTRMAAYASGITGSQQTYGSGVQVVKPSGYGPSTTGYGDGGEPNTAGKDGVVIVRVPKANAKA